MSNFEAKKVIEYCQAPKRKLAPVSPCQQKLTFQIHKFVVFMISGGVCSRLNNSETSMFIK